MSKISESLIELKNKLNISQKELAKTLDISEDWLSQLINDRKKPSSRLERDVHEMLTKLGDKPIDNSQKSNVAKFISLAEYGFVLVPLVSWAMCGHAKDFQDLANQTNEKVPSDTKDPNAFAVELEGDSMEPEFRAGERIVFAPNLEPRNGDLVLVKTTDESVYFKRLQITGENGSICRLISANPLYKPLELPWEKILFIYPAWNRVGRIRK